MRHKLANVLKLLFTVMLVLSLGCLIACGGNNEEEKPEDPPAGTLEVKFNVEEGEEVIGYINTEFDVGTILVKQEGVTYTMKAVYVYFDDEIDDEERELVCDGLKFTQDKGLFDVYVTVTATKGDKTATGDITIIIQPVADYLDERLMGNWADGSYAKSINNDVTYIKDGKSSVKYAYSGADHYDYDGKLWAVVHGDGSFKGTYEWQTFEPTDGFAATVTDWSTASLVMWVYNPMDEPIEFFNHLCNVTNGKKKINIDWGKEEVSYLVKTVPAHSWKLVRFELADHGITTAMQYEEYYPMDAEHAPDGNGHYHEGGFNLLSNPPVIGTDFAAIKSRYVGQPEEGFYAYHFYVDGFAYVDKDVADAMDPDYEPVVNPNPPKPALPDGQYYIEKNYVIRFEDYDETQPAYLEFDLEISADGADKFWTMLYRPDGKTVGPYKFTRSGVVENPPTPGISRGAYVTSNNEGVMHVVFSLDEVAGDSGVKFIGMSDYNNWTSGADGIISNVTVSNVRPEGVPEPNGGGEPIAEIYPIMADYSIDLPDYDETKPAWLEFDLKIESTGADKFWVKIAQDDSNYFGQYKFTRSGISTNDATAGAIQVTSNDGNGLLHIVIALDELTTKVGEPTKVVKLIDHLSWCTGAEGYLTNIKISDVNPLA